MHPGTTMTRMSRYPGRTALVLIALLLLMAASCTRDQDDGGSRTQASGVPDCTAGDLPVVSDGVLTVAVDGEWIEPWFIDEDLATGRGYAVSVAHAVAAELGFGPDQVNWVRRSSDDAREVREPADFSMAFESVEGEKSKGMSAPYYRSPHVVVVLGGSRFADAAGLDEFAQASLGARGDTGSLRAIETLGTMDAPLVFVSSDEAAQALANGQVDGIVANVPSASLIVESMSGDAVIAGVIGGDVAPAEFELEATDPSMKRCLDAAVSGLEKSGTLRDLEKKWLHSVSKIRVLSRK